MTELIQGEKTFTNRVRAKFVEAFIRLAEKDMREAARHRELARKILEAKTSAQLERVRLQLRTDEPCLLEYVHDTRGHCHYCKKKGHGGVSGLMLSEPERFCCWKEQCHKQYMLDCKRDAQQKPRIYAAYERKLKTARSRQRRRRNFDHIYCPSRKRARRGRVKKTGR